MTEKALEKLNENQLSYCKTTSTLISKMKMYNLTDRYDRQCGKLRGFLECLCMMRVITGPECKDLFEYFSTADRW